MRTEWRVPELEREHGDLKKVIPKMVNKFGQRETAKRLKVSQGTISRWLKQNGYQQKWVKRDSA